VEGERAWDAGGESLEGFEGDLLVFFGGAGGVGDCRNGRADAELGGVVGEGLELGEFLQSAGDGGYAGGEGVVREGEADLGGGVAGVGECRKDAGSEIGEGFLAGGLEGGKEGDAHGGSIEFACRDCIGRKERR
jgi:hypothetical protein